MTCPLCKGNDVAQFVRAQNKDYFKCADCEVRYLAPEFYLSARDEHAHYLHHENEVDDPGYRMFLNRLAKPLLQKLDAAGAGLDFGCGPGPALADIMEKAGHAMALYDPFFFKNEKVLDERYDFIVCTETVEHFHNPAKEFARFDRLLKTGGWLGVMTCFHTDDSAFADWHYRRDPTHVVFYRQASFEWLAGHFGWSCEFPAKDVVLMQK